MDEKESPRFFCMVEIETLTQTILSALGDSRMGLLEERNLQVYKITWDKEINGVRLHSRIVADVLGTSPRPVFFEELDLLGLDKLGWKYPHCEEPLLWAINKQYYYKGELVFEAKGANIYDAATVVLQPAGEHLELEPMDVETMLYRNKDMMFLLESEAIEFIHETYEQYARARKTIQAASANTLDFEALAQKAEKKTKKKMAIVKEDCDSFDIMPLEDANNAGKRVYQTTKIDKFIASFSGGKDSQVVLDLCTRAIPSTDFEVIYSDTGYELPPSLELYDKIQKQYKEKFPDLKFSLARNHDSVLNYWDKIGTPSDTHRWCCSVMKTAPLYRMLRSGSDKLAKILTFDGVRAEESTKRSAYQRKGKGKHTNVYNAHPILYWNTIEIFFYLFKYHLDINIAYRYGKARVGCLVCPFATTWDDMVVSRKFAESAEPFMQKLQSWSKYVGIHDTMAYLKDRKWKIKAIGGDGIVKAKVQFKKHDTDLIARIENPTNSLLNWMFALGEYSITETDGKKLGSLNYKKRLYDFSISESGKDVVEFRVRGISSNPQFGYLLKRLVYKSSYCVHCEVCEADCPTGALQVTPNVSIDKNKCIHCLKCFNSHDRGCIAADSVRMITDMDKKLNAKIKGYKTFGLRNEWLSEYSNFPDDFWGNNSLGTAQEDGFKAWLKDAEVTDAKNNLTSLGQLLMQNYTDFPEVVWEIITINLAYNSFIVKWFCANVKPNQLFDSKSLENSIVEQYPDSSVKTVANAVRALIQTINQSPLGDHLKWGEIEDSKFLRRQYCKEISSVGIAYFLYKYAEEKGVKTLRVTDLYAGESTCNPLGVLGVSQSDFIKALKELNSMNNRVLVAELNMGLDSVTLRNDLTSISVLEQLMI